MTKKNPKCNPEVDLVCHGSNILLALKPVTAVVVPIIPALWEQEDASQGKSVT